MFFKYKFFYFQLVVVISFLLLSCEDYLSEIPDNRTQIDSIDKISELIAGAYPQANYMDMAETMSDNAGDRNTIPSELNLAMYTWDVINQVDLDYPTFYWNSTYTAIAQANQALQSIKDLGDTEDLKALKGEALLCRAYGHFMLVNFWGKHYDPQTANSDLGISYIEEPETEFLVNYSRNTVADVYRRIERDLLEGITLVSSEYDFPEFHFTKEAAYAFASRFYLYTGDWDEVIKYSSRVLLPNPVEQVRDLVRDYIPLEYSEKTNLYSSTNDDSNLLLAPTNSVYARTFASNTYALSTNKVNELFNSGNIFDEPNDNSRRREWIYEIFGRDISFNIPKFSEFFRVTNQSAGIGDPYTQIILFSIEELILARAEAYAMKEQFGEAIEDMTAILSKRTNNYNPTLDVLSIDLIQRKYPIIVNEYEPFYQINDIQNSFIKFIAEVRRREFYHEGLRWFDVRRFNLEVIHSFVFGEPIVLQKDDNRRQLQIPPDAVAFGNQPNPR